MASRSPTYTDVRALVVAGLVVGATLFASRYVLRQEEMGPKLHLLKEPTAPPSSTCNEKEIYASANQDPPRCFRRCASSYDCPKTEECLAWDVADSKITTAVCTKENE